MNTKNKPDYRVFHLASGQAIIGNALERVPYVPLSSYQYVEFPYEIFVTPGDGTETVPTQVTLMPFGSLFGLLPGVAKVALHDNNFLASEPAPDELVAAYLKASLADAP